jgi:hypothetical protein
MEHTECFKTSAYKIQTPGNYPEESRQRSEQGKSLKSGKLQAISPQKEAKTVLRNFGPQGT